MKTAVKRDGQILKVCDNENEAFCWLLSHQPQLVDWETKHEGYSFADVVEFEDGILADPGTAVFSMDAGVVTKLAQVG